MRCPFCRESDSRVVDSRTSEDGAAIRRRRQCRHCGRRFTTMEATSLSVIKRSGVTEEFSRQKIMSGVRKACQGRPVSDDDLAKLAQRVEENIRSKGIAEIEDRKSTRLNSSHVAISYAVFCLKKKTKEDTE